MKLLARIITAAFLLALAIAAPAQSVDTFSNFGPQGEWDSWKCYDVRGPAAPEGSAWYAMSFSPEISGNLESLRVGVEGRTNYSPALAILTDDLVAPSLRESWIIDTDAWGQWGLDLESKRTPLLEQGKTYWLEFWGADEQVLAWMFNPIGDVGTLAVSHDNGASWDYQPGERGAFSVTVNPVATASVPEGSSIVMLISGLLAFGGKLLKRNPAVE